MPNGLLWVALGTVLLGLAALLPRFLGGGRSGRASAPPVEGSPELAPAPTTTAPTTTTSVPEASVASTGEKTVLIVDDDSNTRDLLGYLLKQNGYKVLHAGHGMEALEALEKAAELPSLILLDLRMPVMDGWQFRARQRESVRFSPIPVVVISSSKTLEQDVGSIEVMGFLRKPIHKVEFIDLVRRYCG